MSPLRFRVHGLDVCIRTDDADLRDFVQAHFEAEACPGSDAELLIEADWRWGELARAAPEEASRRGMERAGRGLVIRPVRDGAAEALRATWDRIPGFPELAMSFEMGGEPAGRLKVEARCGYAPRGLGRRLEYLRRARADRKRNRLFFKMMYFMVYYPLAWHLETTRGWGLLHASAVTIPSGRAVVLAGLGGAGKSTLGMMLLSHPGASLLSDNLVFHDERRIYSCPEPVRLDEAALEGLRRSGLEPQRSGVPLAAHPKPTYRVATSRRAEAAVPAAVYFLRFAPRSGLTRLDAGRAAEMLLAGNDLAREIKDYRPCAALLTMLAAERGWPPRAPRASLRRLLEPADCAVLRIGQGERPADTAARLADLVEAPR